MLTRNAAQDFPPTWSPNGRRIAFTSNRPAQHSDSQEFDIWVMNADGSGQRRVTRMPGGEWNPAWQPSATSSRAAASAVKDTPPLFREAGAHPDEAAVVAQAPRI